jgi:hypothetical protein
MGIDPAARSSFRDQSRDRRLEAEPIDFVFGAAEVSVQREQ